MVLVSRNDVLGTAAVSARMAAQSIELAREGTDPRASVKAAVEELVQALAETAYIDSGVGSVGDHLRDLDSDGVGSACDHLAARIRASLLP